MLRRLLTPGWLALHVVGLVTFVGLVQLGRWQWERAEATGRFQNYSYAVEWWLFAAFAVFLWVKMMVDSVEEAGDRADRPAPVAEPVPPPRPAPAPAVVDDDDPELAEYNRRLAALHARDQAET